ncbi:MAG: EAL domain-containing protein [Halothiobacillaceae bacterium]
MLARHAGDYTLVLEITETSLISRFELMSRALRHYRSLGIKVALDDFGSGYSSLRYLARMPVDIVKLDRSLIESYSQDATLRGMVVHVADMLRGSGFAVVAEGIETESQRQDFQRLGVGYLQGWAFGRPRTTGATRARPVSGGLIAVGAADQEEGKKMVGVTGFEPTTPTSRT